MITILQEMVCTKMPHVKIAKETFAEDTEDEATLHVIFQPNALVFPGNIDYHICECISRTFLTRTYPPKLGRGSYTEYYVLFYD
jgi:hypothetical protein